MMSGNTYVCEQCGQTVDVRPDRSGIVAHRCPHGVECILEPGDPRIGKSGWACKVCMPGEPIRVVRVPEDEIEDASERLLCPQCGQPWIDCPHTPPFDEAP